MCLYVAYIPNEIMANRTHELGYQSISDEKMKFDIRLH